MKTKVITIVGTRPEIIKLSRVIAELEKHTDHILVHTGQNYDYELNEIFFNDLKVKKPDYFLDSVGDTTADTIANIISKSDKLIAEIKPDAVLLYGDTNSCLSVISAKKQQVPIFHMEAGNRSFDQRVPEELNRKIVDHLSDINMPLTEQARDYLISEGIRPETIIKTGSCMKEILSFYKSEIAESQVLKQLKLSNNKFFVVSAHREENVDYKDNLLDLIKSLNKVAEKYKLPVIVSTHPRTQNRIDQLDNKIKINALVKYLKPVGFFDYIKLQQSAFCVLSDSGTITEESSILSFPAIMIRKAHERPEGMDEGTLIMSGLKTERIIESIEVVTKQHKINPPHIIKDYDVENVSIKVTRIILSYIDYINRTVWKKGEATKTFQ
ncbi:MAG: UDP-N-acetylglucosamine 2-epimerase (non-hydrolyzing) [Flavobacteriaceae bacterium]|nr:UDP-N-acetylglucosamine 2-epimerase (non-hydrolyzing) [Flavobacteriaceae bacterium]